MELGMIYQRSIINIPIKVDNNIDQIDQIIVEWDISLDNDKLSTM